MLLKLLKPLWGLGLIIITATTAVTATDLGLGKIGQKSFGLNPVVNNPELKFESTAPLEDIVGYVKDHKLITSSLKMNTENIEKSTGNISFKVEGINTGIDMRDEHLRSEMWLNTEKFPEISYILTGFKNVKIKSTKNGRSVFTALATGKYNMNGLKKNLTSTVTGTYIKETSKTKKRAEGDFFFIEGELIVKLKDFNIKGSKGTIGNKVGKSITTRFKLFYSSK